MIVIFISMKNLLILLPTSGVNFTNTLHAVLSAQIPKAQKDKQLKQIFALSGSACVKASSNLVDEIDPKCPLLLPFQQTRLSFEIINLFI